MNAQTIALISAFFALMTETRAESVTCDIDPSYRDRSLLQGKRKAGHRWWWDDLVQSVQSASDDLVQAVSSDSNKQQEEKAKKNKDAKDKNDKDTKKNDTTSKNEKDGKDKKDKDAKDKNDKDTKTKGKTSKKEKGTKDKKDKDDKDKNDKDIKKKDTTSKKEKDTKDKIGNRTASESQGNTTLLHTAGTACRKQNVTPMFDSLDDLNALILQPPATDLGFIHIPQNGGSQMESAGMRVGRKWGFNAINHTYMQKIQMQDKSLCSWFLVPPALLPGLNVYRKKPLFCVTRNPTERLFATYLSVVKILDGNCSISRKDHAIFSKHKLCSPASLNFFVTKALADGQYDFDCSLLPQNQYIWAWDGRQYCQEILDFDKLPTALPALLQKYNISLPKTIQLPSLLNETTSIKGSKESLCPGLTVADFSAESNLTIAKYYKDDFELLGYN